MTLFSWRTSTKGLPSEVFWYRVSSKRMTPERWERALGDVKSSSRSAWRLDSMFSTLMLAKRLPMVPVLSSAANMPFPGVAMYLAFFISSSR